MNASSGLTEAARGLITPSAVARLRRYAKAFGRTDSLTLQGFLASRIHALCDNPEAGKLVGHPKYPDIEQNPFLNRGIVLKAPRPNGETGIIHLTPEYNWLRLLAAGSAADELTESFTIWLTVSWSPADYHLLGLAASRLRGTLFVSPGNRLESAKLERFHPKIKCVPVIASDWIDPSFFQPKPQNQRQIDVLMVANWAPFKRHWHLFSALRKLPKNLRVTLIGQSDKQYTLEHVQRQMRELGVPQDIRFLQDLSIEEVYACQCDSRVSVVFSRREGSCVVVAESLFADTPVGLLRGARIGSAAYINDRTGVFLDRWKTASQLGRFLDDAEHYQPRSWAIENISCSQSLTAVNDIFRSHACAEGRPWTTDMTAFCWKPNPTYLRSGDREKLLPVYHDLQSRYPTAFGPAFCPPAVYQSKDVAE